MANKVSIWKRTKRIWSNVQELQGKKTENFGTSICLDPLGRLALIGAPTIPTKPLSGTPATPGKGGTVYMYRLDTTTEQWSLCDTYADPSTAATARAFGYWVQASSDFQIASISTNQNNVLQPIPASDYGAATAPTAPFLTFVTIDQTKQKFIPFSATDPKQQFMPMVGNNDSMSFDPTFGASVSFGINTYNSHQYIVTAGSPYNESFSVGQLDVKPRKE